MTTVLALDLASVSGWAVGEPGGKPEHGAIRFASVGASHEAVFAGAFKWMINMVTEHQPSLIVWEAPLPTSFSRGKTTADVTSLLFGLPAIVGCVAYQLGIYDIRKADTRDVRLHFIGSSPKRAEAKRQHAPQCPRAKATCVFAAALVCVIPAAHSGPLSGLHANFIARPALSPPPFRAAPPRSICATAGILKPLSTGNRCFSFSL
jgi:crossover junction endodeoxyribonuclease RuvC